MKRALVLLCLLGLVHPAWAGSAAEPADKPLPEVSWEDARSRIGQECVVVGRVVQTRNIGSICFLNFHPNYREHFTAVIRQQHYDKFPEPPETLYADKQVRVSGTVIEYRGKPEIVVTGPEQIVIVSDETDATDKTGTAPEAKPAANTPVKPAPATPVAPEPAKPAVEINTRPFDGTVTIASYNVLNLFDEHDSPYHPDEGTRPKPSNELEHLAATIHKVNADVLALQEVENRAILEQFNRALLPDLGYEHVVLFEGNDKRGIDVALLSRLPVGPVTSYRHVAYKNSDGRPARLRRDLLRARIEPPGVPSFDVFVMHLKSKRGGEAAAVVRMGEAQAARDVLDAVLSDEPDARFVLCGDLNDTFESKPIRALVGQGSTALQCFFSDVPEGERITFNREPYRSMIDFILCSPAMAARYQAGSYRIYAGTVEDSGSDHNPISARFKLN